jgi:hypothetical protein
VPAISYELRRGGGSSITGGSSGRGIGIGRGRSSKRAHAARPIDLVRWHRSDTYFSAGATLIWEYPRVIPEADQVEIVEVMEIADHLIRHHLSIGAGRDALSNALSGSGERRAGSRSKIQAGPGRLFHISHAILWGARRGINAAASARKGEASMTRRISRQARVWEARMPRQLPGYVSSPLLQTAKPLALVRSLSDAQHGRDLSYRDRAATRDGAEDDHAAVPLAPGQWPRVFPGL